MTYEEYEIAKEQAAAAGNNWRWLILDIKQRHPDWTDDDIRDYLEDL